MKAAKLLARTTAILYCIGIGGLILLSALWFAICDGAQFLYKTLKP